MRAGETELQMCIRHVAEQENRVARQDILVERLREGGSPLFDDALQLLAEMYGLLEKMREHVEALHRNAPPLRATRAATHQDVSE
jgi:hypothetical protein